MDSNFPTMKYLFEKKGDKTHRIAKLLMSLGFSFFLISCAAVDTRHAPTVPPATPQAEKGETTTQSQAASPPGVEKEADSQRNEKIVAVAGAVVATVATIWVVTEFIEEKVVPAVLGLAVAYLLYQASRSQETTEEN